MTARCIWSPLSIPRYADFKTVFLSQCFHWSLSPASAQVTASIRGIITDSSGGAVPAAEVTAVDLETGATRITFLRKRSYLILPLPVGRYEIKASKSGFQDVTRSGINLVVNQEAMINLLLPVGTVQSKVTVVDDAPIVNTSTSDISGVVDERLIKDLPLNGRSYDLLLPLNPGIVNFTSQKTGGLAYLTPAPATISPSPAIARSKISSF